MNYGCRRTPGIDQAGGKVRGANLARGGGVLVRQEGGNGEPYYGCQVSTARRGFV